MYNQYKRRAPKKSMRDYFMPFFIILMILAIVIFGWKTLNKVLIDDNKNTISEKVFLDIENGSAKAMTVGKNEWKNVPDSISLYAGEKIKTSSDGRVSLAYMDQSITRMDYDTEIELVQLQKKNEASITEITMNAGQTWSKIEKIYNPNSAFTINTGLLTINTKEGVIAVTYPGSVYVISGSAEVQILQDSKAIKTVNVGVGQQLEVDEEKIMQLTEDQEVNLIFAISDTFKTLNWYNWNMIKDGAISASEETDEEEETNEEEDNEEIAQETTEEVVNEETDEEEEDLSGDTTPPDAPAITEPGSNGETVEIDDVEQIIEGTVSSDTYAVVVNDYKLSKFKQGDKKFQYYAKVSYDNLQAGENEYIIYAEDKAGNKSETVKITLVLDQDVIDEAKAEAEEESANTSDTPSEESLPESTSEGGVSITEPNDGESFTTSETEFEIKGLVPAKTAKVVVNNYTLTLYEAGSTEFRYTAKSSFGNLEIGEKNTYTVKAYDENDELIGTASITIDVQSGSASSPVIIIPTNASTYSTTLNEIVIGGTVGKWVQKVYINDELLSSYIPGSEEWRKTILLESGENTFTIYGETDSEKTDSATIVIDYTL